MTVSETIKHLEVKCHGSFAFMPEHIVTRLLRIAKAADVYVIAHKNAEVLVHDADEYRAAGKELEAALLALTEEAKHE